MMHMLYARRKRMGACVGSGIVVEWRIKQDLRFLTPREKRLFKLYGLLPGEYERILERQGGGCAICGREAKPGKHLHVDHRHADGLTRGILCWVHNAAIGKLRDNAEHARRIAAYLDAPPATATLGRDTYGLTGSRATGGPEKLKKWAERAAKREAEALASGRTAALREERNRLAALRIIPPVDILLPKMRAYVEGRDFVTTGEVAEVLGLLPARRSLLRASKCLQTLGWKRRQARTASGGPNCREWRYYRNDDVTNKSIVTAV